MESKIDLAELMQQFAERRRRDAALEAYRQEVQTADHTARGVHGEPHGGYADMLRDMKGEAAPELQTMPPYIAEPEITPQGVRTNAYRQTLYGITTYL